MGNKQWIFVYQLLYINLLEKWKMHFTEETQKVNKHIVDCSNLFINLKIKELKMNKDDTMGYHFPSSKKLSYCNCW